MATPLPRWLNDRRRPRPMCCDCGARPAVRADRCGICAARHAAGLVNVRIDKDGDLSSFSLTVCTPWGTSEA